MRHSHLCMRPRTAFMAYNLCSLWAPCSEGPPAWLSSLLLLKWDASFFNKGFHIFILPWAPQITQLALSRGQTASRWISIKPCLHSWDGSHYQIVLSIAFSYSNHFHCHSLGRVTVTNLEVQAVQKHFWHLITNNWFTQKLSFGHGHPLSSFIILPVCRQASAPSRFLQAYKQYHPKHWFVRLPIL